MGENRHGNLGTYSRDGEGENPLLQPRPKQLEQLAFEQRHERALALQEHRHVVMEGLMLDHRHGGAAAHHVGLHHVDRILPADMNGDAAEAAAQSGRDGLRARPLAGCGHVGAVRELEVDPRAEGEHAVREVRVHERRGGAHRGAEEEHPLVPG